MIFMADFDFGTIIYLLLIALVTILGGRKKKKTPVDPYPETGNRAPKKDVLEEILQQIVGIPGNEEKPVQPVRRRETMPAYAQPVTKSGQPEYLFSVENNYPPLDAVEQDYFEKKQDFFETNKKTMDFDAIMEGGILSSAEEIEASSNKVRKKTRINLRDAVIYSEIINRKSW
jgi:hypothetical protein